MAASPRSSAIWRASVVLPTSRGPSSTTAGCSCRRWRTTGSMARGNQFHAGNLASDVRFPANGARNACRVVSLSSRRRVNFLAVFFASLALPTFHGVSPLTLRQPCPHPDPACVRLRQEEGMRDGGGSDIRVPDQHRCRVGGSSAWKAIGFGPKPSRARLRTISASSLRRTCERW
jgi:hypothetical protein